ncbi:inositol-tetrakisphosphate 1-kinase-like [Alligator sinensis]|uniref:Inositol-tetrakisphosphate 1-kinase-like n=1 Tax=Alligator sinensis TaxID=38654 RepID=A0A3Q0FZV6_ALLSI|nr:inositol-tetrakisphosphate 1-kinase-like [Alligator sinensis]
MPGRGRGWRIGYCLQEQKKRKLNFQDFEALCRERGHEVVELDLGRPLSPQGPFDVILHKPSDLLLASDYDIHAQSLVDSFQAYTDTHARTLVLDPLSNVRPLLDRFESCLLLRDLRAQDNSVFSPPCVELPAGSGHEALGQVLARGLTFPLSDPTVCPPGYEGVPEFFPALLSHIETLLETREREEPPSSPPETP